MSSAGVIVEVPLGQAQRLRHLGRDVDRLQRAGEDPSAGRDERPVVVVPRRPRQVEQSRRSVNDAAASGVGVDEDVPVVEGGDEPDVLGEQHAVAEDVTAHVADAHDR
jgi:hypothetical protein